MDSSAAFSLSRAPSLAHSSVVHLESDITESKPSQSSLSKLNDSSSRHSSPSATPRTSIDLSPPQNLARQRNVQPFDGIDETEAPQIVSTASRTQSMRRKEQLYFLAVCFPMFLAGWNDASAGPLLPRLQEHYNIGYVVVSMTFVANCVGFIFGAVSNVWLNERLGFGKTICLGVSSQALAYCIQIPKPPFPIMVLSYVVNGFGEALANAQACGLVATLPTSPNAKMSMLHGLYGTGAFSSPLVATQFSALKNHWSLHYATSLGVALISLSVLLWVSRLKTHEVLLREIGVQPQEETVQESSMIRQIMNIRLVHLLAIFALVYVGAEVTIGGWIVTFLLDKRGAGPSAGYVSSGFFGGIALGRIGLIWVNRKIGQQRVIYIYCIIAIALELTIWFTPSLYENAIAVSLVGVALGPFYPIVMNVTSVLIPRRVLTPSIGWIASIGQAGSAAFPFMCGVMAEKYGVQTLQPLVVSMLALLFGMWYFVPRIPRHSD